MDSAAAGAGAGAGAGSGAPQHTASAGGAGAAGEGGPSGDSGPVRLRPQAHRPYSKQDHNAGIHERNIYKTKKPDFAELAVKYPRFTKLCVCDCAPRWAPHDTLHVLMWVLAAGAALAA